MDGVFYKQAATADRSKLVGSWSGYSTRSGQSAFFQAVTVDSKPSSASRPIAP